MNIIHRLKQKFHDHTERKSRAFLERSGYEFNAKTVQLPEKYTRFIAQREDIECERLVSDVEVSLMDTHRFPGGVNEIQNWVKGKLIQNLAYEILKYADIQHWDCPIDMKRTYLATVFVRKRRR